MIGRFADLLRLAWGLLYWNIRKSWFRWRRGRSPCPCQNVSDSGRPYETGCEASASWHNPRHFRLVCPLLVDTPRGLQCSVEAAHVRPFWGRPVLFYTSGALALYLAVVVAIFAFLRTVGYPISILHLAWPPSWHKVGTVRGWFFMDRSQRAFAAGRPSEGMLYLSNAYEFDPANYLVGLTLAQKLQLSQPSRADAVYRRLLHDHPEHRALTYQFWFRALLARGDFAAVEEIARLRISEDPANASVWMRALVFAARQTGDTATLRQLLDSAQPAITPWHPLLETELLLQNGRRNEARARLLQRWPDAPPFSLYYQIEELIASGDALAAVDLLEAHRQRLDDTARVTLLLHAYATMRADQSLQRLVGALLDPPLTTATANLLAAHLIRQPDPATLERLFERFTRASIPLNDDSLESYLALFSAAGAAGDWPKMHALSGTMRNRPGGNALTLRLAEAFFRGETTQTRIAGLLPALPMPLEVHYALLERYPGGRPEPAGNTP